jgi:dTDP-4-dehydrorhamnose reductase
MLGHQLVRQWSTHHDVRATLRGHRDAYAPATLFQGNVAFTGVDVRSLEDVSRCIKAHRPDVIVNAVGLVKQRPDAEDCRLNMEINALLPHRLAYLAQNANCRLVHFSTDCVFSGKDGSYAETSFPDAEDLYGQSKLLGEAHYPHTLTLRTSIIGRELSRKAGLLEWFLAQRDKVRGFTHAIYTGFTTLEMARIVENLLIDHPKASGLWHVSSEPISKYELLCLVRTHFRLDTEIVPDGSFVCDRSLTSERFRSTFGYAPPSWDKMIEELASDDGFYE